MKRSAKEISDICPLVKSAGKAIFKPNRFATCSALSDYDLHFVSSGTGKITINKTDYYLEKGDVLIIFPGEEFSIYAQGGDENFVRYYIHFDFCNISVQRKKTSILKNGEFLPRVVHLKHGIEVKALCSTIVYHKQCNSAADSLISDGALKMLLGLISKSHLELNNISKFKGIKCYKNILKAEQFIRNSYQEDISLKDIAKAANLSQSYFCNIFKKIICKTPIEYLINVRVEQAKRLMIESEYNISQISYSIGYKSPHYFSHIFKQKEGITPSEFLSSIQEDTMKF